MGKIRRGGYIFITWIGDHSPRHVHVWNNGKLVVKWDLENEEPMEGAVTGQIRKYIDELKEEGRL